MGLSCNYSGLYVDVLSEVVLKAVPLFMYQIRADFGGLLPKQDIGGFSSEGSLRALFTKFLHCG